MKALLLLSLFFYSLQTHAQNPFDIFKRIIEKAQQESQKGNPSGPAADPAQSAASATTESTPSVNATADDLEKFWACRPLGSLYDPYGTPPMTVSLKNPDCESQLEVDRSNKVLRTYYGSLSNAEYIRAFNADARRRNQDRVRVAQDKERADQVAADQARARQVGNDITSHRKEIEGLGFAKNFLQATIYLNTMGQNGKYRRFDEWLALVFSNPTVKLVTQVNIDKGKSRGVTIKQEGQPSLTFLFNLDGDELYLTHMGNNQQAVSVTTSPNVMNRASMEVMRMAREGPYANVGQ